MKTEKNKVLFLDCKEQDIFKQEFSFEHALNIFAIQKLQKRNDWTLSEGQKYELKDGVLIERTNSEDSSKRSKSDRTE